MILFFGREVGGADRKLLPTYQLKSRNYLGPTAMDAVLMANQAVATSGKLVYDPFVGTGSILVAAAHFGAMTMGADIDIRVVRDGRGPDRNVWSNFKQYGLTMPVGLLRADNNLPPWRPGLKEVFDAIICDPPYGVRAGGRKSGGRKLLKGIVEPYIVPDDKRAGHIPSTAAYSLVECVHDLLDLAAKMLVMGGRLVYFYPILREEEFAHNQFPEHPCFKLISSSEQILSTRYSRVLLTMIKTSPYTEEIHEAARIQHLEFRENHVKWLEEGNSCNCLSGQPTIDDEQSYYKPNLGIKYSKQTQKGYNFRRSFAGLEATRVDEEYEEESTNSMCDFFPGFLAIGTLGSSDQQISSPSSTPTFPLSVESITEKDEEVTENDLKLINDELEKVLGAETKDDVSYDSSSRNSDVSTGRSSHVSIITLGGKPIEEGTESNGNNGNAICPLKGCLFGTAIESSETTTTAANKKEHRTSLGELFQRSKLAEENFSGKCEKLEERRNEREADKSAMNLMKEKLKKRMFHACSKSSSASINGGPIDSSAAAAETKLNKGKMKLKSKKGWKSFVPLHLKGKPVTRFSLFRKVNSASNGPGRTPVYLNVYDLTPMNGYVYWAGLGIYHSGVEVHGVEYAFGAHGYPTSGVFEVEPRQCPGFKFRKSILIGTTPLDQVQVREFMERQSTNYNGDTYHLIAKKCNHFCKDICYKLTGKSIPTWVNRLAKLGSICNCILPEALRISAVGVGHDPNNETHESEKRRLRSAFNSLSPISMRQKQLSKSSLFLQSPLRGCLSSSWPSWEFSKSINRSFKDR